MYPADNGQRNKVKIIGIVSSVVVLLIVVVSVSFIIIKNIVPVVIQNLNDQITTISNDDKRVIQSSFKEFLHTITGSEETPQDIYIREGTIDEYKDDDLDMLRFVVDIDSSKISYLVTYAMPKEKYYGQNPIIDCPAVDDMKYPETECVGMYNSSKLVKEEKANPVNEILPIKVDEFDTETGVFTKFDIYGYFDFENEDKFNISIVDYSCDNREKALQMIRDKGFNPDDYEIKYQDECYTKHLPHTGTNSLGNKYRVDVTSTDEGKLYFLIDNYACSDKTATEEASVKAAEDWLLSRGIKLSNYEYGVLTFCTR